MPDLKDSPLLRPFFVPILQHLWEGSGDLNRELASTILAQEARSKGAVLSNVGGWQSTHDFMAWTGEAGRVVGRRILEAASHATTLLLSHHGTTAKFSWKVAIWANIIRRGHWHKMHYHPGATWSGAYYVDPGEAAPPETPGAGKIAFMDPVLAGQMTFLSGLVPQYLEVEPKAGLMILFPAYLPHLVNPYLGERPRIGIAFNVHKEPYP